MPIRERAHETPEAVAAPATAPQTETPPLGVAALLRMQQSAGNQAVSALVARRRLARESAATAEQPETREVAEPPVHEAAEPATAETGPQPREPDEVTDAPVATYVVPFDRAPLSAPGERIIFRAQYADPTPANYRIEFTTTGGRFISATGATTHTVDGLSTGNVDFFVPSPWDGSTTVQVVMKVKKVSDGAVQSTETWNFGLKQRYPTTITQREGTGEVSIPGIYSYDLGPAVSGATAPYYQHQTILERFDNWTLGNIGPEDIVEAYRTQQGLTTAAAVSAHFLGRYGGNNGTFTVNANDRIGDRHGGHPDLSRLVSKLAAPKDVHVVLPQVYEAQPGVALGRYRVTRILKADGTTWKMTKAPVT